MRILKKLLISILIVTLIIPIIPILPSYAAEDDDDEAQKIWSDPEQAKYVETYIRAWVQAKEGAGNPVVYDVGGNHGAAYHQNDGTLSMSEMTDNNKLIFNCAVFTSAMLYQSLGVDTQAYIADRTHVSYSTGGKDKIFVELSGSDILQPGDVIRTQQNGHSLIYVGADPKTGRHQIADTNGRNVISIWDLNVSAGQVLTAQQLIQQSSMGGNRFAAVSRLKRDIVDAAWKGVPEKIVINWPNGVISDINPNDIETGITYKRDDSAPLYYFGIATAIGSGGVTTHSIFDIIKDIVNTFTNILHYAIGLVSMAFRIPIVGLARAAEMAISSALQAVSSNTTTYNITVEKIIFNKVPLFDFNIFDFTEAGGQKISEGSSQGADVILYLRQNIAQWYIAFRNLTIVVMLAILIYLGIRMAITSIAAEKAHYKRMLVDWFVSFFIVLFIHYFLVIVFTVNEYLVNLMYNQMQNATANEGIYESVRNLAYSIKFTEGWYGTIMYVALIIIMVKYTWKYAKRMLSGYILVMLSPLVAISYALDKIKDNRSQSISKWMKEVLYTVLIQSAHALIYLVFVAGIIMPIASKSDGMLAIAGELVFLIIAIKFMDTAESIFRNIFGFESSSILKETMDSSFELFAKYRMVRDTVGIFRKGIHTGFRALGIVPRFMIRNKDVRGVSKVNTFVSDIADGIESFKEGYRQELNGEFKMDTKGPVGAAAKDMIYEIRNNRSKKEQKAKSDADSAWSSAKGAVRATARGIIVLPQKPKSALLSLAAGGVLMKKTFKIFKKNYQNGEYAIRNIRNKAKTGAKNAVYKSQKTITNYRNEGGLRGFIYRKKEEKLIRDLEKQERKLLELIDEIVIGSAVLTKGDKENATGIEKRNEKIMLNVLMKQLNEVTKIIDNKTVNSSIDTLIMKTTSVGNSNVERTDLFNIVKLASKGNIDIVEMEAILQNEVLTGKKLGDKADIKTGTTKKNLSSTGSTIETGAEENTSNVSSTDLLISSKKKTWEKLSTKLKTDENLDIKQEKFYENITLKLQEMLVDKAMGRSTKIMFKEGTDIENAFERTIKEAQERLKTLDLSDTKKETALEQIYNMEFEEFLSKEYNQIDMLNSLETEDIAEIIIDSANMAQIDVSNLNFRETAVKAIEMARADQTITWDSVLVEAERKNPKVKINKITTKENLRKALEDAMMNIAFKKPESLNINFGMELSQITQGKVEEYNKNMSTYNSLAYSTQGKLKDVPGIEKVEKAIREAEEAVRKDLSEFLSDDSNFNEIIMQIQQNPEGLANLLTRAVNDDGGIERDLEQKAKAMYYDDAIKDTMLEKMPETLEELAEFAKKVDEKVNKKSSGDGRRTIFVPKFGENLENALMNIGNVLANEGTDNTQNTGLSVKTTTKVIEEIKRNNAKGKAAADIVLRNMSADEKKALFERQSYYQPTTKQIEAEIKKFEPAIAIAEKLRKDYVDTLARLEISSNEGVMEKETRTVYNRLK